MASWIGGLFVVLIGFLSVSLFVLRRNVRRGISFGEKLTELFEQQLAVLRQTNELLKKLTEKAGG